MPDTSAVNGNVTTEGPSKFISKIDPDDPDYQKDLMTPASVKEDVNLMKQRRRVSLVLKSDHFRRELEEVIRSYGQSGDYPGLSTSLLSLQHVSELFTSAPIGPISNVGGLTKGQRNGVIPINDLRGGDATVYSRRERSLRCKIASVYRLIDLFGWNTGIHSHVTARIGRNTEHFLVNPFGLLYHEITASSLIKVDSKGQILDPGSTILGINQNTWSLRLAIHAARPDIRCIIHVDTPATIAVSCMKSGFLPLCHEAMILGEVAYYTPLVPVTNIANGDSLLEGEEDKLNEMSRERSAVSEALGQSARVLFLRGRGLLALGEMVEEAWHYATNAVVACETQLLLASLGPENLVLPSDKLKQKTYETWRTSGLGGLTGPEAALAMRLGTTLKSPGTEGGYSSPTEWSTADGDGTSAAILRPWRLGELEFEAMMRHLDNAGCRTGHMYRQEALSSPRRSRRARTLDNQLLITQEDVQIPPTASSATATMAYYEDGVLSGDETETPRPSTLNRDWSRKQWFNTPNKYSKVVRQSAEYLPTSKWVSDREHAIRAAVRSGALPPPAPFHPLTPGAVPLGSTGGPATGTASACAPYNSFAPQGSNPKELKDQQRKVKDKYYHDTNTAGPQSRLLDGLTWDEARRVRDEGLMKALGPKAAALVSRGAVAPAPVSAASKAIIQRDARDNAVVFESLYSHQNPFGKITDEELEMYRREIELKNNPELAAELERRRLGQLSENEMFHSPTLGDSLAVDSGATDLESATETGPAHHWSPSPSDVEFRSSSPVQPMTLSSEAGLHVPGAGAAGTLTSDYSGTEEAGDSEAKGKRKKKRFKLPFSFRHKDKSKDKGH